MYNGCIVVTQFLTYDNLADMQRAAVSRYNEVKVSHFIITIQHYDVIRGGLVRSCWYQDQMTSHCSYGNQLPIKSLYVE